MNDLIHSPPRLSDLHGAERTEALRARKAAHDANWLRNRTRRPLLRRIFEGLIG